MSKRVLIVDDENDMRVYLRTLLRRAGYETEVAESVQEGLEKTASFRPDLITLDLFMPRRSGLKEFRELAQVLESTGAPVIVLTGLTASEELFQRIQELVRPRAIVDKPIDRESFLGLVRGIIGEPA